MTIVLLSQLFSEATLAAGALCVAATDGRPGAYVLGRPAQEQPGREPAITRRDWNAQLALSQPVEERPYAL